MCVHEKLMKIIQDSVSILYENVPIKNDTDIINDLKFDSISIIQLILEIESEFDIQFDDNLKYEDIATLKDLENYISAKITNK